MHILRADALSNDARAQMSEVFVSGFGEHLAYFSKSPARLARALAHMFVPEHFYLAVGDDGRVTGMAALTDIGKPSVRLDARQLRRELGVLKGTIAASALRREWERHAFPFPLTEGIGVIEFVATDASFRGKGIATALMQHIIALPEYSSFVLEVAGANETAVRLYRQIGFEEFLRVPHRRRKRSGVDELLYMRYDVRSADSSAV